MVKDLLKFIESEDLIFSGDKILLAVSGGVDSMVMSELFKQAGIDFAIAHVNYNLRGKDSLMDQEFVEEWGRGNGVEVHLKTVDKSSYESTDSVQMVARKLRYDFFDELSTQHGYNKIATAHHLDDSLETILMNLTRGTGIAGITGIPLVNGKIIRPLLFTDRRSIETFAKENNIGWREDQSNAKNTYHRNLIRNKVVPVLQQMNPSLNQTLKDSLIRLDAASQLFAVKKQEICTKFLVEENGLVRLSLDWVQDDNITKALLGDILADYGMSFKQSKDVFRAVATHSVGSMFFTERHEINLDRNHLIIRQKPKTEDTWEAQIVAGQHQIAVGSFNLIMEIIEAPFKIDPDANVAFLNYDSINWPLKVRKWKQGDKFVPLGMSGKKSVSDFMIDNKIAVTLKKDIFVLLSGDDIAWIVGHRISDLFKVTSPSNKALKISMIHA